MVAPGRNGPTNSYGMQSHTTLRLPAIPRSWPPQPPSPCPRRAVLGRPHTWPTRAGRLRAWALGTLEDRARNSVRRLGVEGGGDVAVDVEGDRNRRVAEPV